MHFEVSYRPSHALGVAHLDAGESVRAEAGAMVSMTRNFTVDTSMSSRRAGGLLKSLKRGFLGGESFFTNLYTASGGPGHITFAPRLCGDMVVHELTPDRSLVVQGSSYVAAPDSVVLDTRWQGFKGFFSGESLFFLTASGHGPVLIDAFGAIEAIELDGELIVDTGHLVAFTEGIDYRIDKAARGWIASYLSGEGLVLRVSGRGLLYVQSRNPSEYGKTVGRRLPAREG